MTATPRVLVVVADPDDEAFGCGPLLLHTSARGAQTVVVCATGTEAGMDGVAGPRTLVGAPIEEVSEALRAAIDRHRPSLVIALDGGDGHRDHRLLRDVLEPLLAGTPIPLYLQCLPRSPTCTTVLDEQVHLVRVNPPWTGGAVETQLRGLRASPIPGRYAHECWWDHHEARWRCDA